MTAEPIAIETDAPLADDFGRVFAAGSEAWLFEGQIITQSMGMGIAGIPPEAHLSLLAAGLLLALVAAFFIARRLGLPLQVLSDAAKNIGRGQSGVSVPETGPLEIRNLSVSFATRSGPFKAVDGINLSVNRNEIVSIVGESGSGKSVAMLAVMGLLPWTATIRADVMRFEGLDLLTLSDRDRRKRLRKDVAMIFQEPMTSLNPCFTVGFQIGESLKTHLGLDRAARRKRAIELLEAVGLTDPEQRLSAFPHQLSGGMSQRVMIAMALASAPKLLIADEPTTALDVTIQAQILDLLLSIQKQNGMGLVLITHDMGVVAETAQRVVVQYAGQQVEMQETVALFDHPRHPYTAALLESAPSMEKLMHLPEPPVGEVPDPKTRFVGCRFAGRCPSATEKCRQEDPSVTLEGNRTYFCHIPVKSS